MSTLTVCNMAVRQLEGLYSLNDLHRAAGSEKRHEPSRFMRLDQTQALIAELHCPEMGNGQTPEMVSGVFRVVKGSVNPGTWACPELVIAYAAWISAAFHLKVIRVFLARNQQAHWPALARSEKIKINSAPVKVVPEDMVLVSQYHVNVIVNSVELVRKHWKNLRPIIQNSIGYDVSDSLFDVNECTHMALLHMETMASPETKAKLLRIRQGSETLKLSR